MVGGKKKRETERRERKSKNSPSTKIRTFYTDFFSFVLCHLKRTQRNETKRNGTNERTNGRTNRVKR